MLLTKLTKPYSRQLSGCNCFFTVCVFLMATAVGFSQSPSLDKDYSPLKSTGSIPENFTLSTKKKIDVDVKQIKAPGYKENKLQQDYAVRTNYEIDKQLHGGNILLNEELSTYVNNVVDKLLKSDPELRSKLKIYVTKVPEMNAYCMGKGYLFVNAGLLAKMENEAQLAYVLAHEISHFVKMHNFNTYAEFKKIDKDYKKQTFEDRQIQKFTFSKENESEADTYGFELFKKSDYSPAEALASFDALKHYDLPFENIPFDTTFFNDSNFKIPSVYFLTKLQPVNEDEAVDDSKSTHPNIQRRKENIAALLEGYLQNDAAGQQGKKKFLVSENEFFKARDVARFEECRLFLIERSYLYSIFSAYILLKKYPENVYLQKVISKSLFAMALYKDGDLKYNDDSYRQGPIPDFTKTEGYSQQLNFMLDRLPQKEMVIMSLKYVWKNHQKNPDDPSFLAISDSLLKILTKKFNSGISEYSDKAPAADDAAKPTEYYKYAFVDYLQNDAGFKKTFTEYSAGMSATPAIALKAFTIPKKGEKKENKDAADKKTALSLGISKIIIVDPFYIRYDESLSETSTYEATDRRQDNLVTSLKDNARISKIAIEMIDPGSFTSDKIALYNDFSVFNDWFNERMEGGEMQSCPVFNSEEIPELIKKYGTKYILWPGVFSVRQKIKGSLRYEDDTFYYSVLFDLETGKIVSKKMIHSTQNDYPERINDYVDDTFDEIRKLNLTY
ncbi:MAG: hypothetical protein JWP12_140 [Bacteroidetes bacterium]|nr:hypothetical protein [Bacteroidota bacterium]